MALDEVCKLQVLTVVHQRVTGEMGDLAAHRRSDMHTFIQKHAGVWAELFGQQVDINDQQLEEVMQSWRMRTDL